MPMTKPTSEQVTFLAAGTGASQRTVLDKLRDVVSVKDFGAVGDGVVNDAPAIAAAVAASASGTILFPSGTYRISTNVTIPITHALWFTSNGNISIDAAVTLTINGAIDAPDAQIFSGAALATGPTFANVGELRVRWFGAKGDGTTDDSAAIQAAVNAARRSDRAVVQFGSGIFAIGTSITLAGPANAITITGTPFAGVQTGSTNSNTVILWTGGANPVFNVGTGGSAVTFCNFYDLSFQNTGTGTNAIRFSTNSAGNVRIGRISTVTKSGQTDFSGPSLVLQGLNYSVIEQVQLLGSSIAIQIDHPTGGGTISVIQDSTFAYGSNDVATQYDPVIQVTGTYGTGYGIEQLLIQNCTFNLKNGRSAIDNALADFTNMVTFRNCEFNGTPSPLTYQNVSGVKIANLHDFTQLLIEDCYISQMGSTSLTPCLVYAYTRDQATPYLPTDQSNISIRNCQMISNGDTAFIVTDGYVRPSTGFRNGSASQYFVDVGYNVMRPGNHGEILAIPTASAYNAATGYVIGNRVTYSGIAYYCIQAGTGQQPNISPTYWLAQHQASSAQEIKLALQGTLWQVKGHLAPVNVNSVFVLNATTNPASATTINVALPSDGIAVRGQMEIGQQFSVRVINTSGGALSNISFGSQFKQPAVTLPATGNSRTWHFVWNGTNAIEINRTAADVPN